MRLVRLGSWGRAALLLVAMLLPVAAAERSVTLLPDTDLPGFDYEVLKGVSRPVCEAACLDDRICRAFTFNSAAGWCFLKSAAGAPAAFSGAVSGEIVTVPGPAELAATRAAELPFPAEDLIRGAENFAAGLRQSDPPPPDIAYADLVAAGDAALAQSNPAGAMVSYRQALAITGNDPALWLQLAEAALVRADAELAAGNGTYELGTTATYAALNAFLRSETVAEMASALAALAHGLERREMWREAIAGYRQSIALIDAPAVQARLDRAVAEHGFRVTSHEVDAEAATPRLCAVFSEPLPPASTDLSGYVVVEGAPQVAVETTQSQICISGLDHGRRYQLRLRAGLPSAVGETLGRDVALDVYVPDRAPFVGFASNAYVMPAGLGGGLPINSVNADSAELAIYRIGDRALAAAVRSGVFQRSLDGYRAEDIAGEAGEKVWEGEVALADGAANAMVTTAIPVTEVLGELLPGAYVVTARVKGAEQEYWREMATQWFIVSDLGLTAVSGEDGVHAFVRSLESAEPVPGATVRLVAVNNEILGEATTDEAGRADFAPGLSRGTGGNSPQLLVVETAGGDYAFLDLARPAFDLTDRGVEGRPASGPLDLFLTTERGVYRLGETVFLTALLRDSQAEAVTGLPLTLRLERPDGVVATTELLTDAGAGSYFAALPLLGDAMRGSWRAALLADPDALPLGSATFLVEDFEPERLAFEVSAPEEAMATGAPTMVAVAAKYLYGATAPDLAIEADLVLRPVSTLAGFGGYSFGRTDDGFETWRELLGTVTTTDTAGNASAAITVPEVPPTTRPLEAQLLLRLVDSNGRTVERSLTRPVRATTDRIGLRPQFDVGAGLAEGSEAAFDVIVVDPDGDAVAREDLAWRLSRVETNYQWYRSGGNWKWEAVTTQREVANGSVDAVAAGPARIAAPVEWGRYLLEVETTGPDAAASSYEFRAGYYYADAGSDTPDTLQVALDKDSYGIGETAMLRLEPQFAGTALVLVVDDGIIEMQAVEVPAEGLAVPLTVTEAWGPGAYVTAVLYRPASSVEKRMPARALGLAFAETAPGDRRLDLAIEVTGEVRPRATLSATVRLGNLAAGEEAYVALAAVDLGILNLTGFRTPDPDAWYFGQRQLGVAFRDLYGQLIDPLQGLPGALRSGGDAGATRLGVPPSISVLVALHSGIVAVGPDGRAIIDFEMPDFNGTVRLMAMAWTGKALGHAARDVVVRDPVVVNLSPPRFLRLGDESRLLVEIDNVEGPAGTYSLAFDGGPGVTSSAPDAAVELETGERAAIEVPLAGAALADQELALSVTTPDGSVLEKQLTLGVRATSAVETSRRLLPIAPGDSIMLDASLFDTMVPHTGDLTLAVGPIARLDVPGLLLRLDRYPYGCAEQVTSRVFPLLYLNEVAEMLGMGSDSGIDQRIAAAIADLLAKQNSGGSFGLWGPYSGSDPWLDAYVTEFLLRARAEGHAVPERALGMALDNLANQVAYASDFSQGGEAIAYALYDLARAGRAAIGDLRYYLEARLDAFATPLAKAQLGAALALYGDRTRAATAFEAALAGLEAPDDRRHYRADYGSRLRDTAAVLALAAEFAPPGVDLAALASGLAEGRDGVRYTSTQEDAWTLIAAAALAREAADGSIAIDSEELTGPAYRRYGQEEIEAQAVRVTNRSNQPTEATLTVAAIPADPPPARSAGFSIERAWYLPDGTPFDPASGPVRQNDRFVVVLTMTAETLGSGQYIVNDPLPAGFEIENPDLSAAAGLADLAWLTVDVPAHAEARTDAYVAAFRYVAENRGFATAYMVRAVTPGSFALPGATVEDMYRPQLRGNTAAGHVVVEPAGPAAAPPREAPATRLDR